MDSERLPRLIAITWAGAFLAATVMGFVPNPLVGDGAIFHTNQAHNLVHLVTAVAFLIVAFLGSGVSVPFMAVFGVIYFLVGLVGFAAIDQGGQGHLLGIVHINKLDNFLHFGLGVAIFGSGLYLAKRNRAALRPATAG